MSSSYCNVNNMKNDVIGHPDFEKRLQHWTSASKCTPISAPILETTCSNSATCCLTDAEIACYSSYQLGKSREKLDADLKDIYQPETSQANVFQSNLETTILTGVVWAMLGTTILYYAFTKI